MVCSRKVHIAPGNTSGRIIHGLLNDIVEIPGMNIMCFSQSQNSHIGWKIDTINHFFLKIILDLPICLLYPSSYFLRKTLLLLENPLLIIIGNLPKDICEER